VTRGRILAILIVVAALAGAGVYGWMQFGDQLFRSGQQSAPKKVALRPSTPPPVQAAAAGEATPMAQRVATIALLNKRNGETRDLEMKPGESRRVGNAIVRLSACERTAPWEQGARNRRVRAAAGAGARNPLVRSGVEARVLWLGVQGIALAQRRRAPDLRRLGQEVRDGISG
jgi:hypothetical protein